jgi:predicted RNA-binding Zn ribbon-like protein
VTYVWPFVGGHPVLDLVDTISWRLDPPRTVDRLRTPDLLGAWAAGAAVVDASDSGAVDAAVATDPVAARRALADLHALRALATDLLDQLAVPPAGGSEDARIGAALDALRARYVRAVSRATPRFPAASGRLTWSVPLAGKPGETLGAVADRLAIALVELLSGPDLTRLRRCEGEGCGWLFLDLTRNHSRRWCAAGDCGNRTRVRRHRAAVRRLPVTSEQGTSDAATARGSTRASGSAPSVPRSAPPAPPPPRTRRSWSRRTGPLR